LVSPASPVVSAPDKRQNSSLPPNSVQAAPNDAITTTAAAPATTATTELPRQPVAASKKPQKTAGSQNRPDRGWYRAFAWRRPHADYARGRGYGHERSSSSWGAPAPRSQASDALALCGQSSWMWIAVPEPKRKPPPERD